jgi:Fe-S cluster assembly scaffold protein SufB
MTTEAPAWEILRKQALRTDEFRFVGIRDVKFPALVGGAQDPKENAYPQFGGDPFVSWAQAAGCVQVLNIGDGSSDTKISILNRNSEADPLTPLLDVRVGEGAMLDHIVLIDSKAELDFFPRVRVQLQSGAKAKVYFVQKCSGHAQLRVEAELLGENAQIQVTSILSGDQACRFEHGIRVRHLAPHTTTQMDSLALLQDSAHAIFRGQLEIERSAPHSRAFEKSRALLLSESATFDVLPQLWIATDEVQCSHGASVSSFAEDEKFYLSTRGVSEQESETMLRAGLLRQALSTISCTQHRFTAEEFLGVQRLNSEDQW